MKKKANERKTYERGQPPKHSYLLTGHIFCGHCNKALYGQTYTSGDTWYMYYRHEKSDCLKPSYLRAIGLENLVYDTLHKKLSDQQALFKATKKATPTASDQKTLQRKITKAEAGLKQTKRQMDNIIRKISLDLLSDDEAKSILDELREKKQYFLDQIDELKAELKPLPTDSTSATTEKKGRQQKCK